MKGINTVKSFSAVTEVADNIVSLVDKDVYETVAIIGKSDVIQEALGRLLSNNKFDIGEIQIDDIVYDDLYQLLIDDYSVYVEPILQEDNSYWTPDVDMYFVNDWASTRYIFTLEQNKRKYEMFAIIGDDELFEDVAEDVSDDGKLSDKEAEDLLNNAEFAVVYGKYNKLPNEFQQLIDLILDWGLAW